MSACGEYERRGGEGEGRRGESEGGEQTKVKVEVDAKDVDEAAMPFRDFLTSSTYL